MPAASSIETSADLLAELRAAPWRRLFAISDDTWSRVQLAALVDRAGVIGSARFSVFDSGAVAGEAATGGKAGAVLARRGAVRDDVRAGQLRSLAWPFGAAATPRAWVALIASPRLAAGQMAELRRAVGGLLADPRWRVSLRRQGRLPVDASEARLATLLTEDSAKADRLERLARRVESR